MGFATWNVPSDAYDNGLYVVRTQGDPDPGPLAMFTEKQYGVVVRGVWMDCRWILALVLTTCVTLNGWLFPCPTHEDADICLIKFVM